MTLSLARNSLARLASDAAQLVFAFLSGVITARFFEPSGKGAYAALVSLVSVFAAGSSLGLGDAAVILIGRGEASVPRMVSALLGPVLVTSTVAASAMFFVAEFQLADQGPTLGRSILVASMSVPIIALFYTLTFVANATEKIIHTSLIRSAVHGFALVGIIVFVVLIPLHITGGMLAGAFASLGGLVTTAVLLRRMGATFHPTSDRHLIAEALKLGVVVQAAHALLVLAARVDVLFVYSLAGRSAAGVFSVALTMGQLGAFASLAISFALFPRIARVTEEEGMPLIAQASRIGIAVSLLSGAVLLIAIPIVTPLAFGQEYQPAVGPALLMLLGGVFWAEQNLLARARTARGRTRLQVAAYGTTLVVMVVLDLLLIPFWGVFGAAVASTVAPAAGLAVCVAAYARLPLRRRGPFRAFLPRRDDIALLFDFLMSVVRARRA